MILNISGAEVWSMSWLGFLLLRFLPWPFCCGFIICMPVLPLSFSLSCFFFLFSVHFVCVFYFFAFCHWHFSILLAFKGIWDLSELHGILGVGSGPTSSCTTSQKILLWVLPGTSLPELVLSAPEWATRVCAPSSRRRHVTSGVTPRLLSSCPSPGATASSRVWWLVLACAAVNISVLLTVPIALHQGAVGTRTPSSKLL